MIPGISVVIPTYNREKFIGEAIRSVLEQDYDGKIEIIISDDGSIDKTLEIAASFGNSVVILKKPKNCLNQGVAGTRNRGIKACTQEYISFLDSDDFYLPGNLKKLANKLISNNSLGFVFCRMLEVKDQNGENIFKPWTHKSIYKNDIRNPVVSRIKIVHTNSFLFRKTVFDEVGYFNESYPNGEDGDLWMRISEIYEGTFSDHYGAVYRSHHESGQLTKNSNTEIKKCFIKIYNDAISRYYKLELKDKLRLFQLKHWLLVYNYREKKLYYHWQYLLLIIQYPLSYIRLLPIKVKEYMEKHSGCHWNILDFYSNKSQVKQ
ncbi:MAG: glycosyltransferase [Bacteroidota bacterium]|nr:glycosyltransferase [Bacteroidota bacterium]